MVEKWTDEAIEMELDHSEHKNYVQQQAAKYLAADPVGEGDGLSPVRIDRP